MKADCGCSCSRSPINTNIFCLDFELLISGLKDIWIRFGLNYFFLLFEGNTIKAETRSCLIKTENSVSNMSIFILKVSEGNSLERKPK